MTGQERGHGTGQDRTADRTGYDRTEDRTGYGRTENTTGEDVTGQDKEPDMGQDMGQDIGQYKTMATYTKQTIVCNYDSSGFNFASGFVNLPVDLELACRFLEICWGCRGAGRYPICCVMKFHAECTQHHVWGLPGARAMSIFKKTSIFTRIIRGYNHSRKDH